MKIIQITKICLIKLYITFLRPDRIEIYFFGILEDENRGRQSIHYFPNFQGAKKKKFGFWSIVGVKELLTNLKKQTGRWEGTFIPNPFI